PDLGNVTLGDLSFRFLQNAFWMPGTLGQSVTVKEGFWRSHIGFLNRALGRPLIPQLTYKTLLYVFGLLVLLGTLQLMLDRQWLISFSILLTIAAICTTPWPGQFWRYFGPILPLLLIALMSALGAFRKKGRTLLLAVA